MSFELGDKKWKVTAIDCCHAPSQYGIAADKVAVMELVRKAKRLVLVRQQVKMLEAAQIEEVASLRNAAEDGLTLEST